MATTTLTLLNKVLRGLRQFGLLITVGDTTVTDDYLLMLLQFVNDAKEEIEEAGWAWHSLRNTVTVTLASSTVEYDIEIAGQADVDTNGRSRLLYETVTEFGTQTGFYNGASSKPMVYDTTDATEYRLVEKTVEQIERMHMTDNGETGKPLYFSVWSDSDSLKMKVWPTPNATRTLTTRFYIPQAELSSTSITATTLSIPERPVWMRALYKANQERGEELGKPGSALERAMLDAHGSAVAKEQTPADHTVFLER